MPFSSYKRPGALDISKLPTTVLILLQICAFLNHQRFYQWGGLPHTPGYTTGYVPPKLITYFSIHSK